MSRRLSGSLGTVGFCAYGCSWKGSALRRIVPSSYSSQFRQKHNIGNINGNRFLHIDQTSLLRLTPFSRQHTPPSPQFQSTLRYNLGLGLIVLTQNRNWQFALTPITIFTITVISWYVKYPESKTNYIPSYSTIAVKFAVEGIQKFLRLLIVLYAVILYFFSVKLSMKELQRKP